MSEATKSSYVIDFKELDLGDHHFDFDVTDSLFALYEDCEVLSGEPKVEIELQRSESMLVLDLDIVGTVQVECDRCLEPCDVEIDYLDRLVVKFSDEEALQGEYDGEVMWLPTGATQLDLQHYIYESIILSLPYQRVHPEGECNPEMIEKFKIITGEEFAEIEANSEEGESETMPEGELAKLAALKAKMQGGN